MWIVKAYLEMGGIKGNRPARSVLGLRSGRHTVDISTPELLGATLFNSVFHEENDAVFAMNEIDDKRAKEHWMPRIHFGYARVVEPRKPTESPEAYVQRLRSMVLPVLP